MIQKPNEKRRIGVLGGRFDPIHLGHIAIAKAAREQYHLDMVLLLVAKDPPHKPTRASARARYEMAVLAAEEAGLICSSIELDREGTTYTVDSLRELRAIYGEEAKLYYIIGADTLLQLLSWKQAREVMRMCDFIVFYRPGEDSGRVLREAGALRERFGEPLLLAGMPGPDISSTAVREKLSARERVDEWVPAPVVQYIMDHGLYQSANEDAGKG